MLSNRVLDSLAEATAAGKAVIAASQAAMIAATAIQATALVAATTQAAVIAANATNATI